MNTIMIDSLTPTYLQLNVDKSKWNLPLLLLLVMQMTLVLDVL